MARRDAVCNWGALEKYQPKPVYRVAATANMDAAVQAHKGMASCNAVVARAIKAKAMAASKPVKR